MTSNTYDFCVPEAQRLAELGGSMRDLLNVQLIVNEYVKLPYNREDLTLKNALCVSALVTYMRARQTNLRAGVTQEMIEELSPDLQNAHEYFRQMRNKWGAHSVNEHESYSIKLKVNEDPSGGLIPKSIPSSSRNTVFLAPPKMALLHQLADTLQNRIMREMNEEEQRVLEFAKAIDLSKLKADPSLYSCKDIEKPNEKKVRKKFK